MFVGTILLFSVLVKGIFSEETSIYVRSGRDLQGFTMLERLKPGPGLLRDIVVSEGAPTEPDHTVTEGTCSAAKPD